MKTLNSNLQNTALKIDLVSHQAHGESGWINLSLYEMRTYLFQEVGYIFNISSSLYIYIYLFISHESR